MPAMEYGYSPLPRAWRRVLRRLMRTAKLLPPATSQSSIPWARRSVLVIRGGRTAVEREKTRSSLFSVDESLQRLERAFRSSTSSVHPEVTVPPQASASSSFASTSTSKGSRASDVDRAERALFLFVHTGNDGVTAQDVVDVPELRALLVSYLRRLPQPSPPPESPPPGGHDWGAIADFLDDVGDFHDRLNAEVTRDQTGKGEAEAEGNGGEGGGPALAELCGSILAKHLGREGQACLREVNEATALEACRRGAVWRENPQVRTLPIGEDGQDQAADPWLILEEPLTEVLACLEAEKVFPEFKSTPQFQTVVGLYGVSS
jgi:hypothetical protein